MEKLQKRMILKGTMGIGFVALMFFLSYTAVKYQEEKLCAELFKGFNTALKIDVEENINRKFVNYNPNTSRNDISKEEKIAWCDQTFLTKIDPQRHLLDSIFRDALYKDYAIVKSAIRIRQEEDVINTSSDSLFYQEATALEPVVYRIDLNPERNFVLQAYVDIPFLLLIKRIGWLWVLGGIFLTVVFCLSVWYAEAIWAWIWGKRKKERVVPLEKKQSEVVWTALPCGLLFDKKTGLLRDETGKSVHLQHNAFRLFSSLVEAEDYKMTHKAICVEALGRYVKGELSPSDMNSVSTEIHRLKDCLKPFDCIQVKSLRAVGYQLKFANYQNDITPAGNLD